MAQRMKPDRLKVTIRQAGIKILFPEASIEGVEGISILAMGSTGRPEAVT
jgi:hypothetical protein